jgi:hypothetical protein
MASKKHSLGDAHLIKECAVKLHSLFNNATNTNHLMEKLIKETIFLNKNFKNRLTMTEKIVKSMLNFSLYLTKNNKGRSIEL